jgi:hypothetical protein
MKTDSTGTPLLDGIYLNSNNTIEDLDKALVTNTFLLACLSAMDNGRTVIYFPERKEANITMENGSIFIVSH